MPQPNPTFTVDGKTYELKYGFNNLVEAEKDSGCNLLVFASLNAELLRAFLYACLVSDKLITLQDAGNLIRPDTRKDIMNALAVVLNPPDEEEEEPLLAQNAGNADEHQDNGA